MSDINNIDDSLQSLLAAVSKVQQDIEEENAEANETVVIIENRVDANISDINRNLSDIDTARQEAESAFDELILRETDAIANDE